MVPHRVQVAVPAGRNHSWAGRKKSVQAVVPGAAVWTWPKKFRPFWAISGVVPGLKPAKRLAAVATAGLCHGWRRSAQSRSST